MSKMEERSRRRSRKGQLETVILSSLAVAGVGLLALAAPNTLKLLKHADPEWMLKCDPKRRIRESAYRLSKKGLVRFVHRNDRVFVEITPAGRTLLQQVVLKGPLPRAKRWDGKWRIVIFDIPETKKQVRNQVRTMMMQFGFIRLQDSVWAFPYDCEEVVTLLKKELDLGKELLYIIADAIEYDAPLRKHFELPDDF